MNGNDPSTHGAGFAKWLPHMQTKITELTGTGPAMQILQGDPRRYYLAFNPSANFLTTYVRPQSLRSSNNGFLISGPDAILRFSFNIDGAIVCEPWFISTYSLGDVLMIVEGLWID